MEKAKLKTKKFIRVYEDGTEEELHNVCLVMKPTDSGWTEYEHIGIDSEELDDMTLALVKANADISDNVSRLMLLQEITKCLVECALDDMCDESLEEDFKEDEELQTGNRCEG